jgi:hypothetical protein
MMIWSDNWLLKKQCSIENMLLGISHVCNKLISQFGDPDGFNEVPVSFSSQSSSTYKKGYKTATNCFTNMRIFINLVMNTSIFLQIDLDLDYYYYYYY